MVQLPLETHFIFSFQLKTCVLNICIYIGEPSSGVTVKLMRSSVSNGRRNQIAGKEIRRTGVEIKWTGIEISWTGLEIRRTGRTEQLIGYVSQIRGKECHNKREKISHRHKEF